MNGSCEEAEGEGGRTYLLKKEGKDEHKVKGYIKGIVGQVFCYLCVLVFCIIYLHFL